MRRRQQRRGEASTSDSPASDHDGALLDEDDQAQVVASLEQEGIHQIASTNRVFSGVCILAMSVTLVVAFVVSGGGIWQCTHAVYSAGVHWLAQAHAASVSTNHSLQSSSLPSSNVGLLIFLVVSPLFVIAAASVTSITANATATLHWSIALANVMVGICSILLRMESMNTMKALEELEGSKYRYKSL